MLLRDDQKPAVICGDIIGSIARKFEKKFRVTFSSSRTSARNFL
jgi:hypothetical protein